MKLNSPFHISARLMPALTVANAAISLEYTGKRDGENRPVFAWVIDLPDGSEHSGADLRGGCGAKAELQEMFETLFSFLSAAGESFSHAERTGLDGMEGENSDLFPFAVTQWAANNMDEITMAQIELTETPGLIAE